MCNATGKSKLKAVFQSRSAGFPDGPSRRLKLIPQANGRSETSPQVTSEHMAQFRSDSWADGFVSADDSVKVLATNAGGFRDTANRDGSSGVPL
jgi:hypothetical protein